MAYLYAYSPRYRALVALIKKSPKALALFITGTTAAGVLAYKGSDKLTRPKMGFTEEEMKKRLETDTEFKRYAQNSERALATMFEQFGKGTEENEKYLKDGQVKMMIPGVQWHPKAQERGKPKTPETNTQTDK